MLGFVPLALPNLRVLLVTASTEYVLLGSDFVTAGFDVTTPAGGQPPQGIPAIKVTTINNTGASVWVNWGINAAPVAGNTFIPMQTPGNPPQNVDGLIIPGWSNADWQNANFKFRAWTVAGNDALVFLRGYITRNI
jgi:hypothetical protein